MEICIQNWEFHIQWDYSFVLPKQMFKLMDKKKVIILRLIMIYVLPSLPPEGGVLTDILPGAITWNKIIMQVSR